MKVEFDPYLGYTVGTLTVTSEGEAAELLAEAGHPDPRAAIQAAQANWLDWEAIESPTGSRIAVAINGHWRLSNEAELVQLLAVAGLDHGTAKAFVRLTKAAPIALESFVSQVAGERAA